MECGLLTLLPLPWQWFWAINRYNWPRVQACSKTSEFTSQLWLTCQKWEVAVSSGDWPVLPVSDWSLWMPNIQFSFPWKTTAWFPSGNLLTVRWDHGDAWCVNNRIYNLFVWKLLEKLSFSVGWKTWREVAVGFWLSCYPQAYGKWEWSPKWQEFW